MSWSCIGTSQSGRFCTATRAGPPVNGACGTAAKLNYRLNEPFPNVTFCSAGPGVPGNAPTLPQTAGASVTWTCPGSGGGTSASCTAARAEETVACGTANRTYAADETDWGAYTFCWTNSPTSVPYYSPHPPRFPSDPGMSATWTCAITLASGGSKSIRCWAYRAEAPSAQCGAAQEQTYDPYAPFPANLACSPGSTMSNLDDRTFGIGGQISWTCTSGGSSAVCWAYRAEAAHCGGAQGQTYASGVPFPTSQACYVGDTMSNLNDPDPNDGQISWTCTIGTDFVGCNATRAVPPVGAACGNNIIEGTEDCDGSNDSACPGQCIAPGQPDECTCPAAQPYCLIGTNGSNLYNQGAGGWKWRNPYCCGDADLVCPEDFKAGPNGDQIDCKPPYEDPDCERVENCTNRRDDDRDGLIDCLDPDCCNDSTCPTSRNEGANDGLCCDNTIDDDSDGFVDWSDSDCGPTYRGMFNNGTSNSDVYTFNVSFKDLSTTNEPQVEWIFNFVSEFGKCINHTFNPPLPPSKWINTSGPWAFLSYLTVRVTPGELCMITLNATHLSAIANGTYVLDNRGLVICPSCKVLEIPSIIHPIGIYSDSLGDAQKAYISAQATVSSLSKRCALSCSKAAKAKLEEAQKNLGAAEYFSNDCEGDACRLSQYYSSRAKELANEGLTL